MNPYPPPPEQQIAIDESEQDSADRALLGVRSAEDQGLHHFLRLARKYAWLVLTCAALGAGSGVIKNITSPKEYTSTANIEITQDTANQFRLDSGGGYDDGYIDVSRLETEIAILKSSTLALQTIRSLHLNRNPDFLPIGAPHPWSLSDLAQRHALIGMFEGALKAQRSGHTNILELSCTSRSPQLSAEICNTLVDNYVQHNFSDNYAATQEVSIWLQAQLGDLKSRLEKSQEHLLAVQKDLGLVGIDQTQSIVLSRLVDMGHDLTQAESLQLLAKAKLITLQSAPEDVLPALSNDPVLIAEQERLTGLQANYANLSARYGAKNPRLTQLQSEMDQVKRGIQIEQKSVISRAQEELNAATENANSLSAKLDQEKDSAYQGNSKAVEYTLARREYESNRSLYDGLQQRLNEAGIIAGLHSTDIRRIDPADASDSPSAPKKSLNLLLGLLAGLGVGLLLAFAVDLMDTNIKTIYDIEERLGLPMLGLIPRVDNKLLSPENFVADATSTAPGAWSRLAEAYRSLRTSILLSRAGAPPQVILISSAKPSEGKTSISSLEATIFALNGSRVLLIDSDLRRPSVHLRFAVDNNLGLTSVLTGKCAVEEAIVSLSYARSLDILPAGPVAPLPSELLGSLQMRALIEGLRSRYDFILIDTPPVLAVTDAVAMLPVCDGVMLVLRYGEASRNVVARASEILLRSGAHLLGVVLNAVDLESSDYAEYYGRAYDNYYRSRSDSDA